MLRKIVLLLTVLSMLTACATARTTQDTNRAYDSHKFKNHDIVLEWKTEPTQTGIRIDGTVQNVRQEQPYTSFQVAAKLLDAQGAVMSKGSQSFNGRFSGKEPFTLDIPVSSKEQLEKLDFSYSYMIGDDFHTGDFQSLP